MESKKILTGLVIAVLVMGTAMPAWAADPEPPESMAGQCKMRHDFTSSDWKDVGLNCPAKNAICKFDSADYDCAACCAFNVIYSVSNWVFIGVMSLVLIFICIGVYYLVTAAGNADKVKKGKDFIMWAIVGAIVAALAKALPEIVKSFLRIS